MTSSSSEINTRQCRSRKKAMYIFIVCEDCGKEFTNKPAMLRHLTLIHGSRKFLCNICSIGFDTKTICNNHYKLNHEQKCDQCPMKFAFENQLKQHMQNHKYIEKHSVASKYDTKLRLIKTESPERDNADIRLSELNSTGESLENVEEEEEQQPDLMTPRHCKRKKADTFIAESQSDGSVIQDAEPEQVESQLIEIQPSVDEESPPAKRQRSSTAGSSDTSPEVQDSQSPVATTNRRRSKRHKAKHINTSGPPKKEQFCRCCPDCKIMFWDQLKYEQHIRQHQKDDLSASNEGENCIETMAAAIDVEPETSEVPESVSEEPQSQSSPPRSSASCHTDTSSATTNALTDLHTSHSECSREDRAVPVEPTVETAAATVTEEEEEKVVTPPKDTKSKWACRKCQITFTNPVEHQEHLSCRAHFNGSLKDSNEKADATLETAAPVQSAQMSNVTAESSTPMIIKTEIDDSIQPLEHEAIPSNVTQESESDSDSMIRFERVFKCGKCTFRALCKNRVLNHCQEAGHQGGVSVEFRCMLCKAIFQQRLDLLVHQKEQHHIEPLKCATCSRPFACSKGLEKHQKMHLEVQIGDARDVQTRQSPNVSQPSTQPTTTLTPQTNSVQGPSKQIITPTTKSSNSGQPVQLPLATPISKHRCRRLNKPQPASFAPTPPVPPPEIQTSLEVQRLQARELQRRKEEKKWQQIRQSSGQSTQVAGRPVGAPPVASKAPPQTKPMQDLSNQAQMLNSTRHLPANRTLNIRAPVGSNNMNTAYSHVPQQALQQRQAPQLVHLALRQGPQPVGSFMRPQMTLGQSTAQNCRLLQQLNSPPSNNSAMFQAQQVANTNLHRQQQLQSGHQPLVQAMNCNHTGQLPPSHATQFQRSPQGAHLVHRPNLPPSNYPTNQPQIPMQGINTNSYYSQQMIRTATPGTLQQGHHHHPMVNNVQPGAGPLRSAQAGSIVLVNQQAVHIQHMTIQMPPQQQQQQPVMPQMNLGVAHHNTAVQPSQHPMSTVQHGNMHIMMQGSSAAVKEKMNHTVQSNLGSLSAPGTSQHMVQQQQMSQQAQFQQNQQFLTTSTMLTSNVNFVAQQVTGPNGQMSIASSQIQLSQALGRPSNQAVSTACCQPNAYLQHGYLPNR